MVPYSLIPRFRVCFSRYVLGSLPQHHVFSFFFNPFTSHTISNRGETFTVSYLINSCGLTPDSATKLSNGGFRLKTLDGPNAVLDLLKNYGFSNSHIVKLVQKHPLVLLSKAKETLNPKLKFLHSIGVCNRDLPTILIRNHSLLSSSLEKRLIRNYEILRGVVRDDKEVVRALRASPAGFTYGGIVRELVPNVEVLRQCGVPQSSISLLLTHHPTAAYMKHSRFVEAVKVVKEIGIEPTKTAFVMAVKVLVTLSKVTWKSRFPFYEKWGWNREITLRAFRKYPNFMNLSEETFSRKMSFLVKDMGLPSTHIAEFSQVLGYSLEKRIIPRFSVIKILKSKGLVGDNYIHFLSFMCMTDENFLKRFVVDFQTDLPLLPDIYKGLMDYQNVI